MAIQVMIVDPVDRVVDRIQGRAVVDRAGQVIPESHRGAVGSAVLAGVVLVGKGNLRRLDAIPSEARNAIPNPIKPQKPERGTP